jgi:hypothetical protein
VVSAKVCGYAVSAKKPVVGTDAVAVLVGAGVEGEGVGVVVETEEVGVVGVLGRKNGVGKDIGASWAFGGGVQNTVRCWVEVLDGKRAWWERPWASTWARESWAGRSVQTLWV